MSAGAQTTQPIVAVHDSEATRALAAMTAVAPTPTSTGFQWWTTNWNYFVMPESVKECLRSDGTPFHVVGDSNIVAGALLTNGRPCYPIVISLAAESIRDDEIAPFTNYVAAGGFLFVGSSAFTRHTNGTTRGDFAFANEMGIHSVQPALTNWGQNTTLTRLGNHRLVNHLPFGTLSWRLPNAAEETPYGVSPAHGYQLPHAVWQVAAVDATVIAQGDTAPYLLVKPYGKGCFIYCAAMQPLLAFGGWSPGTYSYLILRKAVEWAFAASRLPVPRLSPWPYSYDAAFIVRHDFENYQWAIAGLESSAQFEATNGARGDYYFCTGTLRVELTNAPGVVAGLRRAVTNYGASLGSHNGGLANPVNTNLALGDFDYWHWGPDEAFDVTPPGYASGKAYALTSLSNSFVDLETWLAGINNGPRSWVACYFNGSREDSYQITQELDVKMAGEQKLAGFPHWTLSTRTPGKTYPMLSLPLSDWFVGSQIGQSMEYFTNSNMRALVDFRYGQGLLINLYSHTLSTGVGPAGSVASDYVTYCLNTNLHPRMWAANALSLYDWNLTRSNAQVSVAQLSTATNRSLTTLAIMGAADTNVAVEFLLPATAVLADLQVFTNGVLAGDAVYRITDRVLKLRVGTAVTNAVLSYTLDPQAQDDYYALSADTTLSVPTVGVLANDLPGTVGANLTALLVSPPTNGVLALNTNGAFSYTPINDFTGVDAFTYRVSDGVSNSAPAVVTMEVAPYGSGYADEFTARTGGEDDLWPWRVAAGAWAITNGILRGGTNPLDSYAFAYIGRDWTNYAVQATVQLPVGAYGAGVGGRLNATNGGHYAAWIYPENSPGGSNVIKLIKFQSWTNFAYNGTPNAAMAQVPLAAVGTNAHALKLAFAGSRIAVYFDGVQLTNVTDVESSPFPNGGISVDMWTDVKSYSLAFDDVLVSPVVTSDHYSVAQDTELIVNSPGVLANDTAVNSASLTSILVSGPTNGTLYLTNNGGFTYVPTESFEGVDAFSYSAIDGGTNLGTVVVALTIYGVPSAPVLPSQTNRTVPELTTLMVTNTATDADGPADVLTYTLLSAPANAGISTNGIITWTPTEADGPGTNIFVTRVADSGVPQLAATNSFTVVVTEVNLPPELSAQPDHTVAELTTLNITNIASDPDLPSNILTYSLAEYPPGATINPDTGVITWTPAETQGPSTNAFTTVVSDGIVNVTNNFLVAVTEVNIAPVLPAQSNRTLAALATITVTNTAADSDLPANGLFYLLLAPTNATIDANGIITWTPSELQSDTTNIFTTVVQDDGLPPLSATNSFTVVVPPLDSPPVILSLVSTGNVTTVTWSAISGRTYRLQYKDGWAATNWDDVLPEVVASGDTAAATNAVSNSPQRYFRVLLLPPP